VKTVISILVFFGLLNSCTGNRSEQGDSAINWSDSEYGIAFNVLVDEANDNYDIFTMNIDGLSGETSSIIRTWHGPRMENGWPLSFLAGSKLFY
jgi:hypothetical protein